MGTDDCKRFAPALIRWQKKAGRHDLPWQQPGRRRDPYRVWLAEIMLQQTQVAMVIPYYRRFLARFPDLAALAAAPAEAVMAQWSGLGYYARARNLHRAAQEIAARHDAAFPRHLADIAALPGIGRSTAAAIAVFAFGTRAAILDGNVKRVLARVFGIPGFPGDKAVETHLWALAETLLPERGIATYTQGLMDLGATLCTRAAPRCDACPLADMCVARRQGRTAELPTARAPRTVPERTATLLVLRRRGRVLLEQRPPQGIWGGLLSLPEMPAGEEDVHGHVRRRFGCTLAAVTTLPPLRHAFTHFRLEIAPLLCEVGEMAPAAGRIWLGVKRIESAPLPAPIRRILQTLV